MPFLLVLLSILGCDRASAYPEFIGYKYGSCLTCHYNGLGNGPLNDYGRALWASEIAGRLFSGGRSAEQLGEASGVLGSKPMPWWIRPGAKARYLYLKQNPGGQSQSRSILMQAEANVALFFNQEQSLAFVASYGYVPVPYRLQGRATGADARTWISREHYLRWQSSENWWWYFGKMDKVYGIRLVNHTAYSRTRTGLAMNDQAHGVVAHYIQPTWEVAVNAFAGDMFQTSDLRQVGSSIMAEYEYQEASRIGFSLLYSSNKYVGNRRAGVHLRKGFGNGSAALAEIGMIQDLPKTSENRTGYYLYTEGMQRFARGYHIFVTAQSYKDLLTSDRPDIVKTGAGLLVFPMQRLEFRLELENTRQFASSTKVNDEEWTLLGQVHIAL